MYLFCENLQVSRFHHDICLSLSPFHGSLHFLNLFNAPGFAYGCFEHKDEKATSAM